MNIIRAYKKVGRNEKYPYGSYLEMGKNIVDLIMLTIEECREHLPYNLTDEEIVELRDLLYEFWNNMLEGFLNF